ncbi:hypothetical protein [Actinomadura hibisca]|uniref:hypothetical protein n=1 Tax=Actinomadura hibisca TaxID=68565 RepID=UPI000832B2E7|nr:hypothetical protein [Actinomadura hibisca]
MELKQTDQDDGWAPQACTLPTAERPLRIGEFDALFAEAVTEVRRVAPGRVRMRLRAEPEFAGRAAELAARETGCCSFFTFTLTATGGGLELEISAADQHAQVVAALAERAAEVVA